MENIAKDTSLIESIGIDEDSLYELVSPNERKMQTSHKKIQQSTQTPVNNIRNNFECKLNNSVESTNESLHNTSIYDSFSVESKYDSFEDSLNEGGFQKEINVSQFLSDQVTVRKTRERQKLRSHLCDSLEDICSLVSNADHFSASDDVENINNIFEKHGIYDDSLRNDIYCDKRNTNSNEQYFDDDSLAIFEYEKTFDDSLDDVNVASYVDSLILLRSSKGDAEIIGDKFNTENSCAAKNLFESSVPVIYENRENPSISEDESFKTAENISSNVNSKSVSECHMSEDSLEEIGDISDHIPEIGNISEHIPEMGDISEHIPEIGIVSQHNSEIGDVSEHISDMGDISEHIPEIGDISECIPKIHISEGVSNVPLEMHDTNSIFLFKSAIKTNKSTKIGNKIKIHVDNKEIIPEAQNLQTAKTKLQVDNIKIVPCLSPSGLKKKVSDTSTTKNICSSKLCKETNDSVLSCDQPFNKNNFSFAETTNSEGKWESLDLNCFAESTSIKIVRVSDEFKRKQSESLQDYPLVSSSSDQTKMNQGNSNYSNLSETNDKNESMHFEDGVIIGRVMTIDTKYVIQENLKPVNINKNKIKNPIYEHPMKRVNMSTNNSGACTLNDQASKTIKVIKCTGIIDGKITTIYLDASPILNAFDGQEIKFQLVDYDMNSVKHQNDISASKKDAEICHDCFSAFPLKNEMKIISSSQPNFISSNINNHTERNDMPVLELSDGKSEISSVHIPDNEGLKMCIELSDKKSQNVTVNISLKEQVLENKLYKPVGKDVKLIDKKDAVKSATLKAQPIQDAHTARKDKSHALDRVINEIQENIPSLASSNVDKVEISVNNKSVKRCNPSMDSSIYNADLLQALDLHDPCYLPKEERYLQSRDSIMPLNLCTRDKQSVKKASSYSLNDSKENLPVNLSSQATMKIQKTPIKRKCNKQTVIDGEVKKSSCKSNSCTKIPIRKAESILSTPPNHKIIKTEMKSNQCSGKYTKNASRKILPDLLKKKGEESPKKMHHFCMVRNSISRVPQSAKKPKLKKFQDVESPVAKFIGSAKVTRLKTTHYDPNQILVTFPTSSSNAKAATNACVMSPQKAFVTKSTKR